MAIEHSTIGEKIKADMKEKGLKGSVIAKKMNVSRQTINQIDERKKFDIEFLLKFKEASGLDYTHYAYDTVVNNMAEPQAPYQVNSGNITLTFNVSVRKSARAEFSQFLSEMEDVAQKYGYQIV